MPEFGMGVYDKKTKELQDFGSYDSEEDALNDLLSDIPKGNYGVIEGSDNIGGEYRNIGQVHRELKKLKKKN